MTIGTTPETESWKKKRFCVTHDWNDAIIILKEINNNTELQRAWKKISSGGNETEISLDNFSHMQTVHVFLYCNCVEYSLGGAHIIEAADLELKTLRSDNGNVHENLAEK